MDAALREKILLQLRSEINKTCQSARLNHKAIRQARCKNKFLGPVCAEYCEHLDGVLDQKRCELECIGSILAYLDDLIEGRGLPEHLLERARFERVNVLQQLATVQGELDRITKD